MHLKEHTSQLLVCNHCGTAFENTKEGRWNARQHILKQHHTEVIK